MRINKNYLNAFVRATKSNVGGKGIKDKLIIIESDDWGAIRTPSKEALKAFEKRGIDLTKSNYKVDALASNDDLELLFETLLSYKDRDGQPAKLTANAIMANPDFTKIKESGYTQYFYEEFTETFNHYPNHQNNMDLWKKAAAQNIFQPQFHGREHLNYKRWLKILRSGNKDALFCFDWGATYSGKDDYSFMEAFEWDTPKDIPEQNEVLKDGLRIFEKKFGFSSRTFIAPCYTWDPDIEETLAKNGIQWIQGTRSQKIPTGTFEKYNWMKHRFGDTNHYGTKYNVRNCFFEPSLSTDQVDFCLGKIANAFLFNKPAVISSHRINYIGFIDPANRDRGLRELSRLLQSILKIWPDVKFISTDQLDDYIQ